MNDFETSDQDHLLAGPGSKTKLDPETARIRDAIIESFRDRPISEINGMAKKVLSIETDPVKRLGMLAARVYLLRHRIMNLKMGAEDIDQLGAANKQNQKAEGDTGAAEDDSSTQSGDSDWIRVRMLEEAEMNGMRFFEGIVVDVRKEDATKLVESGQAQIVAEQPEEDTAEAEVKVEVEAEATAEAADTADVEVEVEVEVEAEGEMDATAEGEAAPDALDAPAAEEIATSVAAEDEATEIAAESAPEMAAVEPPADAPEEETAAPDDAADAGAEDAMPDDAGDAGEAGDEEESTDDKS